MGVRYEGLYTTKIHNKLHIILELEGMAVQRYSDIVRRCPYNSSIFDVKIQRNYMITFLVFATCFTLLVLLTGGPRFW